MNHYSIPLAKQELLYHMLQVGGAATVHLHSREQVIEASFTVELTETQAISKVQLGQHTGTLALRRSNLANHLALRDFIEDMANGRHESAAPRPAPACQPLNTAPLCQATLSELDRVTKHGGSFSPWQGAVIAVHAQPDHDGRTAVVVLGNATRMFCGGSSALHLELADHLIQHQAA